MPNQIQIRGVRVHNLKNIDVDIPRDKLVILTGLSGSGKSSLAFDTVYAEGHRRFVESLSSYARMFLGQLDKPDIDSIDGLSPAISIDQKTTSKNPRSTVGTVTEIYDYLRLLYARIGIPHCPICGKEIRQQTTDQIIDRILEFPEGERFMVLAPVVRAQKGMHEKVLSDAKRSGYVRARIDGSLYDLSEEIHLDKNINLSVKAINNMLFIQSENYYTGELQFEEGLPQTTKEDADWHGFGLKSIKMIVQKYGGELTMHAEDGVFHLSILFADISNVQNVK